MSILIDDDYKYRMSQVRLKNKNHKTEYNYGFDQEQNYGFYKEYYHYKYWHEEYNYYHLKYNCWSIIVIITLEDEE